VDADNCAQQLGVQLSRVSTDKMVVLLYEPRFHHAREAILSALQLQHGDRCLVLSEMDTFYDPKQSTEATQDVPDGSVVHRVGGQRVVLPSDVELTAEKAAFLYIGTESAHLTSILLRYSSLDCFSYDPEMMSVRKEGAAVNKAVMRRFFLVQQAKEAQVFGILMGTLGVSKYLDVVHSLQKLIKAYVRWIATSCTARNVAMTNETTSGAGASRTCLSWAR
jgi:diphthamide biosynthesis protein 2